MASFNIHLAIAKLYAERKQVKDTAAFFKGTIDPDLTDNKDETHYGITPDSTENLWARVENKVDLAEFLEHNPIDNDLNLGKFLHLVTDQKFFNEFFGKKFLIKQNHDKFSADLYYSYGLINPYLVEKYKLTEMHIENITDFSFMKKKIQQAADKVDNVKHGSNYSPKCIIDTARIDAFIQEVSKADLENIARRARSSSSV